MPDKKGQPNRMDWCGHVTMTQAQNDFYKEIEHKTLMTETLRNAGMLHQRPSRNPMRAEKTPRKDKSLITFAIPPVNEGEIAVLKKFEEKGEVPKTWVFPDVDWGLMSKFKTQKQAYDKVKQMTNNYSEKLQEFRANQSNVGQNTSRDADANNSKNNYSNNNNNSINSSRSNYNNSDNNGGQYSSRGTGRLDSQRMYDQEPHSSSRSGLQSIREDLDQLDDTLQLALSKPGLGHFSMKTLKKVAVTNPEVAEKARAERAARFVSSLTCDPSIPPKLTTDYDATQSARDRARPVFRPGGGIPEINKISPKKQKHRDEDDPMQKLMAQLKDTNDAIEKQKKKVDVIDKQIRR